MDVFKLDTPSNISEMSEEEILSICSSFGTVKSVKTRAKIVKLIYKDILKYDLSKDLFFVLVDESKEMLVIAPAGGGKGRSDCNTGADQPQDLQYPAAQGGRGYRQGHLWRYLPAV